MEAEIGSSQERTQYLGVCFLGVSDSASGTTATNSTRGRERAPGTGNWDCGVGDSFLSLAPSFLIYKPLKL